MRTVVFFILVSIFLVALKPTGTQAQIVDCWETWSRCTKWSQGGTGTLWKSCNDRCKELGRKRGQCEEKPSRCPLSKKAWTCICY
uniref:Hydramacin-1 n=2 Tax=Hydridae TaxID=6080 RepID=HYDMA_HYDVU|nr:RecName: Full=Hydramacin-1; Short=Hm-1; Flags: Precursor [Hydra vulgaris]ABE26989.1 antimicrobial peptide hydramacin [Hydra vulgaris]